MERACDAGHQRAGRVLYRGVYGGESDALEERADDEFQGKEDDGGSG